MFSVLRKTKVIFKKLFFFFFESQESREAAKNSQQRYASSQRIRRKIGSNQLESREKGNVEEYSGRQATNHRKLFQPASSTIPTCITTSERKPLLPLNLPNVNVPKKRAADPAAKSKANSRTSRSARNSKGYRWILANSLPKLTLPFQLKDSNNLLHCD